MTLQKIAILYVVVGVLSFALGRYTASTLSTTKDYSKQTETDTKTNTNTNKQTVITEKPDGTKTTVITEDTKIVEDAQSKSDTQKTQTSVATKHSVTNASLLVAVPAWNDLKPVYGLSLNKEFIGPVTIGAFGLTNGVLGLSLGINF